MRRGDAEEIGGEEAELGATARLPNEEEMQCLR